MNAYEEAIARGTALLDRERPGWRKRVKPSKLHLADCHTCVLGQVYGSFDSGLSALGLTYFDAEDYGFLLPANRDNTGHYGWLTRAWKRVLSRV